jgi:hypothetical protein
MNPFLAKNDIHDKFFTEIRPGYNTVNEQYTDSSLRYI